MLKNNTSVPRSGKVNPLLVEWNIFSEDPNILPNWAFWNQLPGLSGNRELSLTLLWFLHLFVESNTSVRSSVISSVVLHFWISGPRNLEAPRAAVSSDRQEGSPVSAPGPRTPKGPAAVGPADCVRPCVAPSQSTPELPFPPASPFSHPSCRSD